MRASCCWVTFCRSRTPSVWKASRAFSSSLGPKSCALAGAANSESARTETPMRCIIVNNLPKQKGARELSHAPSAKESKVRSGTAGDDGDAAAILCPAAFVGLGADRAFLAVGNGFDPSGRDALAHQKLLHGIGAAGAQRQVVFAGAAFVGMTFNRDANRRILGEPGGL